MAQLTLLDAVRAAFGGDVTRKASGYLGDPEVDIRRNFDVIIPVTLAAIVNKAETAGSGAIATLAAEALPLDRHASIAELFAPGAHDSSAGAPDLIKGVFAERFGAIANATASYTTGRSSTIGAMFGAVVTHALAVIGRHMRENNLPAGALSSVLAGQKSSIWASVPPELSLASLLGPPARPAPSYVTASAAPPERGTSWLVPVLLLLVAGGVVWWLLRSRASERVVSAGLDTVPATVVVPPAAPSAVPAESLPPAQASNKVSLPNGVTLNAPRGGMEDRLVTFLNDPAAKPDENLWFDFTHLDFAPGTAQLVPGSRKEITNLAQILKAYPSVRVKIGAFTDSSGTDAVNRQLSKARAEAVAKELRASGVGGQIAGVDGYGAAFAKVAPSASDGERSRDRRLGVSVWVR
ncbi:MAG TPA: OmpA family protein [Gemmatimonadales bacterium]|nr:OmpA family protein [Gemmatimonadales bacterium]